MNQAAVPSIRTRIANALTIWSLMWGLAVGAAMWLVADHEVKELLDDALQASAELMAVLATPENAKLLAGQIVHPGEGESPAERFAWQVVGADGVVLARSVRAPDKAWRGTPTAGFSDEVHWRLYGLSLGADGRMLYAAQTQEERREASVEVALGAVLAALAVGLLGHVWLRSRVRAELRPLQSLSDRLAVWDVDIAPAKAGAVLGPAERRELLPVHDALELLTTRLAARIANEQAFSAHAAHALRTPLAGIDAQLAVALRDCPPHLAERLQRVRGASARLQGVVASLLGLFRTGAEPQRMRIDVVELVSRLPAPMLDVQVAPGAQIEADPDLLAAALVNLLDNARKHGAHNAWVEVRDGKHLRIRDDGPGVPPDRRRVLQAALDAQNYEGATGLGLMLADRVARAHKGRLRLIESDSGFIAELEL